MNNDRKEKVVLGVFWIALVLFLVPWQKTFQRVKTNLEEAAAKPFITRAVFDEAIVRFQAIMRADEEKLDSGTYSEEDFQRGILTLLKLSSDLEKKYNVDSFRSRILAEFSSDYGRKFYEPLQRKWFKQDAGQRLFFDHKMSEAREKLLQGEFKDLRLTVISGAAVLKFVKWSVFYAWPISIFLIFFLYVARCQVREISFKELLIVNPWELLGFTVFWVLGLIFNYPESGNNLGVARRYFALKARYLSNKDWGYRLSEQEENRLWREARAPVEKFDRGVEQALVYSRTLAFISSLFVWIFITPLRGLCSYTQRESTKVADKLTEAEEEERKSVIPGILRLDNLKFNGFVQFGALQNNDKTIWQKRIQLASSGSVLKLGDFTVGYQGKIDISKDDPFVLLLDGQINFPWKIVDKLSFGKTLDPAIQALPPNLLITINFPHASLTPTDLGVSASGGLGKGFRWSLGLLNGNGFSSWQDNNKAKDLAAALSWQGKKIPILGIDSLKLRTILKKGKQPYGDRSIFGSDFSLKKGIFTLEGCYKLRRDGEENKNGGWLLLFATKGKWQPLFQYEHQVGKGSRLTTGLNFLLDKSRRLRFNFEKTKFDHSFILQYQVGF